MTIHHACGTNGGGETDHVAGQEMTVAEEHIVWAKTSFGPTRPDLSKVISQKAQQETPTPTFA